MNALHIPPAHLHDTLGRLAYFREWSAEQLARVAGAAQQIGLRKNERLSEKGTPLDAVYVVISGQMRVTIPLPGGMERVIRLAGQGDSLGESCVITLEPCPFDIVAARKSYLLRIDALVFRNELRADLALTERTLRMMSSRLLETLRDIEICAQRTGVQKVTCYLLRHRPPTVEGQHETQPYEVHLPASKQDIAAQLGLSKETFSRVLAFLACQGVIHMKGNHLRVLLPLVPAALNPVGCYRDPEPCE